MQVFCYLLHIKNDHLFELPLIPETVIKHNDYSSVFLEKHDYFSVRNIQYGQQDGSVNVVARL